MRTQVGIVGAGPAGLVLAHLLHAAGVECVILETRSREYCEGRIRAGVLEQGTVDVIEGLGLGARMQRQGLRHKGVELGFRQTRHHLDFEELVGKTVMVYGQHEVVKDLIAAAYEKRIPIWFNVDRVVLHGLESSHPSIDFDHDGASRTLTCDFLAGCDGSHGISRPSVPTGVLTTFERVYPFSWLGVLANAAPSQDELVYMNSDRGFALFSMRSPTVTRLYLQCENDTDIQQWSDDRIWTELLQRLQCSDGWKPNVGPVLQKSVTPMRSFVTEPMQFGRLYLVGDAVHIVPPTGAKGMNLAVADARILAEGFVRFYRTSSLAGLDNYSATCLRRIWKAQRFSWWMTTLLHRMPDANDFDRRRQMAELDYVTSSHAAAVSLAENYVGLPMEGAL